MAPTEGVAFVTALLRRHSFFPEELLPSMAAKLAGALAPATLRRYLAVA